MALLKNTFFVSLFLWAVSFSLLHHGWANYNQDVVLDYSGEVLDPTYENPHSTMKIEHEGEEWLVILAPASRMQSRGLSAEMLKEDLPVRVIGYPHKTKEREMRAERIYLNDQKYELR